MVKSVPSFKYYFPPRIVQWILEKIQRLFESGGFITQGKYAEEFEEKFARYIGCKHAVTVASGTAALEIIFRAIGVQGYDVIMPTNTFAATAYAVIYAGGRPVFADIAADMNVSIADIKRRMTTRTKVIAPVHIGGLLSPNLYELMEIAKRYGIHIVEDAAHAHGSMLNDRKAGTFGHASAFSFFSTKVMTTGEGGMITTDDDEIAEKAKLLRNQGKIRGNLVSTMGYNWRMTEFQAIIGLAQLRLLEEILKKRERIAKFYDQLLKGISVFQPLRIPKNVRCNYYKYIVFLQKGRDPRTLQRHLREKYNVSLAGYVYEVPLHRQPVFEEYVTDVNSYPVADDLCNRHIALPIYPQMTEDEAHYVVESLKQALHNLGWI
ncbi:MAG: DegT/DnrJ/EryC1/StrS family aminotransferase [Candidatus Bathyarchaeia archaeon]